MLSELDYVCRELVVTENSYKEHDFRDRNLKVIYFTEGVTFKDNHFPTK